MRFLFSFILANLLWSCHTHRMELYVTTADRSMEFTKLSLQNNAKAASHTNLITLNAAVQFQEMDGFGAAITGSSCYNLLRMKPENRTKLLRETFDPKYGMGYSYVRISIGCSDFSLEDYTYCDQTGIENFAIHPLDKKQLFPILKELLAINPKLKIMASPWTCPKWMKVNNLKELKPFDSWTSGQLNPKYYRDYAEYFVKYITAMKDEGFEIESITIQNEPLNRGNSASLYMTWQEQRDFIKQALGPAFEQAGIKTKIVIYDHNYDYDVHKLENHNQVSYPMKIYQDTAAARYIDGAAFHAYGGHVVEMSNVHNAEPNKNLYFTEVSIGLWDGGYTFEEDLIWNMREVCIGSINNYSKAVILWNFMLDDEHGPFRPGGCDICLGCIDIDSDNYTDMIKNSHYYTVSHLSKVVKPGAKRIESKGFTENGLHYTAFINPDNSFAAVMLNENPTDITVAITDGNTSFLYTLAPKSVASFRW